MSRHVKEIFGRDRYDMAADDDGNDCSNMEAGFDQILNEEKRSNCLLYTSPSPRDKRQSRMPSSA